MYSTKSQHMYVISMGFTYLIYVYIVLFLLPFFIMTCTLFTSHINQNQITTCKHKLARQESSSGLRRN